MIILESTSTSDLNMCEKEVDNKLVTVVLLGEEIRKILSRTIDIKCAEVPSPPLTFINTLVNM